MSEQWWEVFLGQIRPVTVVKETDKTVTVSTGGGRTRQYIKRGKNVNVFRSEGEAIEFVEKELCDELASAQERVKYAQGQLDKFREEHRSFAVDNCEHVWLDAMGDGDFCYFCGKCGEGR